jgi:uncharacterized protein YdeI (YjbR/CyaY-like superfamily)
MKKMKPYPSFEAWANDQNKDLQTLIKKIRKLVTLSSKKLDETVKWGNGCWTNEDLPIVYIYAADDHLQLGFFAGSLLKDTKKILQGKGKFVRFIKIKSTKDIEAPYIKKLIKSAIKIKYR